MLISIRYFYCTCLTLSFLLQVSFSKIQMQVDVKGHFNQTTKSEAKLTYPVRLSNNFRPVLSSNHFKKLDFTAVSFDEDFANPLYKIDAFEEELLLRLKPDKDLLAPSFTTTYSWSNRTTADDRRPTKSFNGCFYKGEVIGKPKSRVALSICGSLTGSIEIDKHSYLITPLKKFFSKPDDNGLIPHSIQRRSIGPKKKNKKTVSSCGVNEKRNQRIYRRTFKRKEILNKAQKIAKQVARMKRFAAESTTTDEKLVKSRSKRSFESRQHFIETMVVADASMVREHGKDLEHYLLTIMMMANKMFSHPSLASAISLSVVKIMIMENDDGGLQISTNAAHTLRNFCYWQKQFNSADDTDPRHYDLAILFTKKDLCGASCDTLGMAEVGGMCSARHSCAIVEDDGLSSSQTLAHEVGHVLNMMHDDNRLCRENFAGIKSNSHIMSSTITRIDKEQPWSECSRQAVIDFLQDERGNCLLDKPQQPKVYPHKLPGEMYGVTSQCEMSFGQGARECPYMRECGRLWCQTPSGLRANQCHTRNFPKADGSPCTFGNHCIQGSCVPKTSERNPIDGGWGSWGQYGTCSRSCGGGVQKATRQCNNPVPQRGGKYCIGSRMQFRSCNIQTCPSSSRTKSTDFRSEQCASYNGQRFPMLGVRVASTWIPKYSDVFEKDKCKLICQSLQTGAYITLSDRVVDGTRCGPGTSDICVHGQCMPAGCDGVLGSKAKYNKCGLCNMSNKYCARVRGSYNKRLYGYNDVFTFPKGAASIRVQQKSFRSQVHDGNYLALVKSDGRYVFNGGLTLTTIKKDIETSGTIIQYSGVQVVTENITSSKPLTEPLTLQILSLGLSGANILPPRIRYSYFISKSLIKSRRMKVKPTRTTSLNTKRRSKSRPTGRKPTRHNSPVRWVTGRWSKCKVLGSRKCGVGWKKRKVSCKSGKRRTVGCDIQTKPYHRLPCYIPVCPTKKPNRNHGISIPNQNGGPVIVNRNRDHAEISVWNAGLWSSCSASCGMGTKRRQVICQTRSGRLLNHSRCDLRMKPSSVNGCKLRNC